MIYFITPEDPVLRGKVRKLSQKRKQRLLQLQKRKQKRNKLRRQKRRRPSSRSDMPQKGNPPNPLQVRTFEPSGFVTYQFILISSWQCCQAKLKDLK